MQAVLGEQRKLATIYHIPALLTETLEGLNISPEGVYVDVTLGGGGHSRAILARLVPSSKLQVSGRLYSFDQDMDALVEAEKTKNKANNWTLVHGNFRYVRPTSASRSTISTRPNAGSRSASPARWICA